MTTDSHSTNPGFHGREELQSARSCRLRGGRDAGWRNGGARWPWSRSYARRVNLDDLPRAEFAFPGPLRDQLVAAILSGAKTSTSALVLAYERLNEPLPSAGQRQAVVDSADRRVAAIELTGVRVVRLADIDLQHVLDEGEGDESVAQWRAGHESFWQSSEVRAELGDPGFTVNDDTLVLAQRFRLVQIAGDMRT